MRLDQALCSIESPHDGYYYLTLRTVWDTQSRWRVFGRQGSATTPRAHHKCQAYEEGGGGGGGGDGGGGDGRTTQVVPVATRAVSMRSCAGRVEKR